MDASDTLQGCFRVTLNLLLLLLMAQLETLGRGENKEIKELAHSVAGFSADHGIWSASPLR